MAEEENLREQDQHLRNQIQNLLESKEGRNLWAGEIQFQSIQLNNSSASISYVDADGVKSSRVKSSREKNLEPLWRR